MIHVCPRIEAATDWGWLQIICKLAFLPQADILII